MTKEEIREKLIDKIISHNYTEFGNEFGDTLVDLKNENQQLKETIEKAKIEISALMSRYFYEEDFYIEDTDLDRLLQILDKGDSDEHI